MGRKVSIKANKWCPFGCGKSVFYYHSIKAFRCTRCHLMWKTTKDLIENKVIEE